MSVLDQTKTLLFTSVGNEALHGFVTDLRRRAPRWRLVGVDIREDAAGRYLCDEHLTVPRRDAPEFLLTMRELVERFSVDLVVPLSTEDQDYFARPAIHAALAPAVVLTSSEEAVRIANRKTELFAFLADRPHLLPRHALVRTAEEANEAIERLVASDGAVLLKSDASTGGRGMVCIGRPSHDPAPAAGRRFVPLDVWRELSAGSDALRTAFAPSVWGPGARWPQLANAYLPGAEYSVDVLCEEGRVHAALVRRRDAAVGGLATTAEVVDEPDVEAAAEEIVRAVGLSHVVNVQFRRDAAGEPKLMEINPRSPGTIGLTVAAGFNLPLAAFARALGGEAPLYEPRLGLKCFRYHGMVLWDADRD